MTRKTLPAVSLFSNCGAGDVGFRKAGFRFAVMAELDDRRLEIALLNHEGAVGVPGDLRSTWPDVVAKYREVHGKTPPALLAACPPCQGMSSARSHRGSGTDADAGTRDERNLLVTVIAKVAAKLKPRAIVVENVPAFLTRQIWHPRKKIVTTASKYLVEELAADYEVFPLLVDLCEFEVPQSRKRTFLTFIRRTEIALNYLLKSGRSPYPVPTSAREFGGKPESVAEALARFNLGSLDADCRANATSRRGGGLHSVPFYDPHRYATVAAIPKNTGRSAWSNCRCAHCGDVKVGSRAATCPKCRRPLLRPVVQKKGGGYRLITGFRTSTYMRMHARKPAATITTASGHVGSNKTIHPYENRVLSSLECARLQTFPTHFKWGRALSVWGHSNIREMIGEAVPPHFTFQHGSVLKKLLSGMRPRKLLPESNRRCRRAMQRLAVSRASHDQRVLAQ